MSALDGLFVGFLVGLFVAVIMMIGSICDYTAQWQRDTVKHGAAEWVMNPETGATEWRWKEAK